MFWCIFRLKSNPSFLWQLKLLFLYFAWSSTYTSQVWAWECIETNWMERSDTKSHKCVLQYTSERKPPPSLTHSVMPKVSVIASPSLPFFSFPAITVDDTAVTVEVNAGPASVANSASHSNKLQFLCFSRSDTTTPSSHGTVKRGVYVTCQLARRTIFLQHSCGGGSFLSAQHRGESK